MDNRAISYASKEDMIKGTTVAIGIFAKFDLTVHIEIAKKASKTEAVFFPRFIILKNEDLKLLTTELLILLTMIFL